MDARTSTDLRHDEIHLQDGVEPWAVSARPDAGQLLLHAPASTVTTKPMKVCEIEMERKAIEVI